MIKDDSKKSGTPIKGSKQKEPNPLYAGTYYVASAREEVCKGKKYGDYCEWVDDNGNKQTGACVYARYDITPGPLFCARRDYRNDYKKEEKEDN